MIKTLSEQVQEEFETSGDIRYLPCVVCSQFEACNEECLRFKVYVNQEKVRLRRQNFLRFMEKNKNVNSLE